MKGSIRLVPPRLFSIAQYATHTHLYSLHPSRTMSTNQQPQILDVEAFETPAKWLKLEKIRWKDQEGKERFYEVANRSTRKGDVDSCHILALLHHPTRPLSTIVIEQYRPPVSGVVIELPAGLIDEGESAATTALRELHEETGYAGPHVSVRRVSPVLVKDPGMTGANMHLVTVDVRLGVDDQPPVQKLDPGEHIVTRIVPVSELAEVLAGYAERGFAVDALLASIAEGFVLQRELSL